MYAISQQNDKHIALVWGGADGYS